MMPPLLLAFWTSLNSLFFEPAEASTSEPLAWEDHVQGSIQKLLKVDGSTDAYFEYTKKRLTIVAEQKGATLNADVLDVGTEQLVTTEDLESRRDQVERLLTEGVVLTLDGEDWAIPAQLKDLQFNKEEDSIQMTLSEEFTNYVVATAESLVTSNPQNLSLLKVAEGQESNKEEGKAYKVDIEGRIAEGKTVDTRLLKVALLKMIQEGQTAQEIPVSRTSGQIIDEANLNLGSLSEIGVGKSTFWGSSPEREYNIEKALNEKFNGIVIPVGAEFSYEEFLGPIAGDGWKQAYTIVKGTQLEKAPAGGVCQVSTTVYRAALDAALPLTEQRAHSLYVVYYNDYGDGLDATVYSGEQDLKFVNNTPGPLLMIAQEEGYYEAVIRFFGQDDGRETTLIGPYTASNQDDESKAAVGPMGIGDMAWKYIVTNADGTTDETWIHNSYMSIAKQHKELPTELDTSVHLPHP